MEGGSGIGSAPVASGSASSESTNKKDPAWKYNVMQNPKDANSVQCVFCGKNTNGGIYSAKLHQVGVKCTWKEDRNRIDRGKSKAVLVPNPKKGKLKGPMFSFAYKKLEIVVELRKEGRLRQTNVDEKLDKERRAMTIQYFSRFLYQAEIPFNVTRLDSFKCMVEAIGQYGPNLKPPSYHEVRVTCLKKEVEYTNELLKSHKDMWVKYGCSIMTDG
ncbi:hypothetical protein Cni_G19538 [Canna indica]|uniref:BED-type domain-containing protein n=1 Tax=Canna indica TaxID=4628 RepID=A0AAQ3KLE5_9LILI|nr:hypothetical protein Cni_G19538 [Canna indica]